MLTRFIRFFLIFLSGLSCFFSAHATERSLKNHAGETIAFSALKGQWVFINYWASWCPGCVEEIPELNRFYAAHKKDAALFAVNFDGLPLMQQRSLVKRFHIDYPSLSDDPSDALQLGDIRGIPVTFVFNPQGTRVATLYGAQTAAQLDELMSH